MNKLAQKERFVSLAHDIEVFDYLDYRDYLAAVYKKMKTTQKQYSYAQFSQDLNLGQGNVSWLIITGRRRLSPAATQKVIRSLQLKKEARKYFSTLVLYTNARLPEDREKFLNKLKNIKAKILGQAPDAVVLEYFSAWYHPVIREMCSWDCFRSDPLWIVEQLHHKLLPRQAKESLEILEKLELIEFSDELGRHIPKGEHVLPSRQVGVLAAVKFHQEMLDIARESITRIAESDREMNVLTVNLSRAGFEELREKIRVLCQEALHLEEKYRNQKDQSVFQFNIQLFPMTKRRG